MQGGVVVAFLDDGAKEPVELTVSEALAEAIGRAVRASDVGAPSDAYRVSFTTLFIGLAAGRDAVGDWLRDQFRSAGDFEGLLARRNLDLGEFEQLRKRGGDRQLQPVQRTQSARAAL